MAIDKIKLTDIISNEFILSSGEMLSFIDNYKTNADQIKIDLDFYPQLNRTQIGFLSNAGANGAVALGTSASAAAPKSVQLGAGLNISDDTIQFRSSGTVTETQFGYLRYANGLLESNHLMDDDYIISNNLSGGDLSIFDPPLSSDLYVSVKFTEFNTVYTEMPYSITFNLANDVGNENPLGKTITFIVKGSNNNDLYFYYGEDLTWLNDITPTKPNNGELKIFKITSVGVGKYIGYEVS